MQLKIFKFNKLEKTPKTIEDRINNFIEEGHTFKFGSHSESSSKSRFILSFFYEKKESTIRVKVFKDQDLQKTQDKINEFLDEGHTFKWATQSSVTASVYFIVFYEPGKINGKKEAN